MGPKISVALLGYGFLGKWHAQKVESSIHAYLAIIVEPDQSKHRELQERHPKTQIYTQLDDCLDKFEAALVVTPTSFHFDLCLNLLKHHKHVFCEKPVTETLDQSLELIKNHQPALVFQVGHSERCHQIFERQELLAWFQDADSILEISRQSPFKGRATDVDVVQDLMIHDLDLLLWLIPERPKSVRAYGYKVRTKKWDQVVAHFFYESGRLVTVKAGRCAATESRFIECTNTQGQLFLNLLNNEYISADGNRDELTKESYPKRDHLMMEQESFYQAIKNKTQPMVTLNDGMKAVSLIEAVLKSLELKKECPWEHE
jgi:predicted dehydrogenase